MAGFYRRKINDKKDAIYTGNIGPVNNSTLLKETAKSIQAKGKE